MQHGRVPGPLVEMGKWGVRVHPVIVRRCSGPCPVGSLWRWLVPIAVLASILAGKRLIAISGKLAAVRAGSVSSVVHRGAFLFKTRFACPRAARRPGRRQICRHDEIRAHPSLQPQEAGHGRSRHHPFDLVEDFLPRPAYRISEMKFFISSLTRPMRDAAPVPRGNR